MFPRPFRKTHRRPRLLANSSESSMNTTQRRSKARRFFLRCAAFGLALSPLAGCTPKQEGELLVDIESDRQINTDLSFPKNPKRWAYIASRYATGTVDGFDGYRVVLANPFAARLLEEGRSADRGLKFAQFIHEPILEPSGVAPGRLVRVNLMVLDPERYVATGGWGYASYDGAGHEISIQPSSDCVACHQSGPKVATMPVGPAEK